MPKKVAAEKPLKPICRRLAKARANSRMDQDEVAAELGVSRERYSKWESRTAIPLDFIPKAAGLFGVDPSWLAWDAGAGRHDVDNWRARGKVGDFATDRIPQLDVKAGLGEGEVVVVEEVSGTWSSPARFFGAAEDLIVVDSKGDSMKPTVMEGDRVVIDRRDKNPSQGGVFALWDGYGLRIKRVENLAQSKPWRIRVLSENPIYPADEMEVEEHTIVGRVVGLIRRFR